MHVWHIIIAAPADLCFYQQRCSLLFAASLQPRDRCMLCSETTLHHFHREEDKRNCRCCKQKRLPSRQGRAGRSTQRGEAALTVQSQHKNTASASQQQSQHHAQLQQCRLPAASQPISLQRSPQQSVSLSHRTHSQTQLVPPTTTPPRGLTKIKKRPNIKGTTIVAAGNPSPGSSRPSEIPAGKCEEEDELCLGRKILKASTRNINDLLHNPLRNTFLTRRQRC